MGTHHREELEREWDRARKKWIMQIQLKKLKQTGTQKVVQLNKYLQNKVWTILCASLGFIDISIYRYSCTSKVLVQNWVHELNFTNMLSYDMELNFKKLITRELPIKITEQLC